MRSSLCLVVALLGVVTNLVPLVAGEAVRTQVRTAVETDSIVVDQMRRAGAAAIEDWVAGFVRSGKGPGRVAVLPLAGDLPDGYFAESVRHALIAQGAERGLGVFAREEKIWESLLAEIRRGDQWADTMVAATIPRFGRMEGVEAVVVGRVAGIHDFSAETAKNSIPLGPVARALQVRVLLGVYEVETGRLLWGAERIGRAEPPPRPRELPGTPWQWLGGGALAVAVTLAGLLGVLAVRAAHRPR